MFKKGKLLQALHVTRARLWKCKLHFPGRFAGRKGLGAGKACMPAGLRPPSLLMMADWAQSLLGIKGLLLDVSGVLYDSGGEEGGGVPIPGSIEAVKKIKASGLKLRFCTNETQATREKFVEKLQRLGFDIVVNEVTAPAPAACRILKERQLRPHLLVHDDVLPEFEGIDKSSPNCVVVGDAADNFSYKNLNDAFRVLIGLENPVLLSLGKGRYYKETDGLKLDVGVYMKALEYACDIQAEVVGKPAKMFFQSALTEMGIEPHQAIMIGDDIVHDVGGAQQCGMKALQVRTGKYRPCDEQHPEVTADGYVNNLAEAVDVILKQLHK
uniref:Phospholysine phosphohistidine inorganic pyrophosphate phosphatase n=1 Tax=Anolis carolinensis TaxID=28377 RepID=G1KU51_ANOCA|nr:PREDICTED: phospholysine phosphohistidine inorganic pyrophosphate phosphatase isoform X1 [Anolis carolinensis]XP_008104945.1 PREDICTED: phospholysine phosphohistidine inorganic pyrophosphate phosphatase isoform X1 [Anolis carolinensis]XP_008104946.1 PREDICTED: phospholysine phosphohistidine inorganic pyrophosphate phosphatase isoform X1 [Anolis carolinensis]XP_016847707.1 PREDICTED: phospholysine phosphohistidine inorganic pyrophosphate phosphatase isoform X1 [Anolis carolinensis]|eukprot:XP_003218634.2 PREDICTED: phospholysine phosphohistidine inorganic pyrophosphate phosphatase isoform X1 [Anolis carolinensis]